MPDLVNTGDAKMDLSLGLLEKAADGGAPAGVSGDLEYAPDLFDAGTAALIVECFLRFLAGAVGDPDGRIGRVAVLSADQRRRVLVEWNDTSSPVGVATLAELFAAQVARTPDGVALVDAGGSVSYRELDARASRWAGWLAARGVGPERFAGVALGRSVPAVVALLAVAKAGGAFLPLDVSYPVGRLRLMADDAAPVVIVCDRASVPVLEPLRVPLLVADDPQTAELLDGCGSDLDAVVAARPQHPAYVMFTSGSAGRPKGVVIEHPIRRSGIGSLCTRRCRST